MPSVDLQRIRLPNETVIKTEPQSVAGERVKQENGERRMVATSVKNQSAEMSFRDEAIIAPKSGAPMEGPSQVAIETLVRLGDNGRLFMEDKKGNLHLAAPNEAADFMDAVTKDKKNPDELPERLVLLTVANDEKVTRSRKSSHTSYGTSGRAQSQYSHRSKEVTCDYDFATSPIRSWKWVGILKNDKRQGLPKVANIRSEASTWRMTLLEEHEYEQRHSYVSFFGNRMESSRSTQLVRRAAGD